MNSRSIRPSIWRTDFSATPKDKPLPFLKIEEVADFYAALRNNRGRNDVSSIALELYMHTVLRNSELRWARWENVRDDRLLIPEGGMKRVRDESLAHIVPLSTHSLALLKRLRGITGDSEWLFPKFKQGSSPGGDPVMSERDGGGSDRGDRIQGPRRQPRLEENLLHSSRTKAVSGTPTGSSSSLPITGGGASGRSTTRRHYLPHRHKLMQWWSDQLSEQERIANDRMALEDDLSDILG